MKLDNLFTMPLSVASHSFRRLPLRPSVSRPSPILFWIRSQPKPQKTKNKIPSRRGKKNQAFSNQTGSWPSMCVTCGNFMSPPTTPVAQPILHGGPCHTARVTFATRIGPAPLAATPCHATEGVSRNTFGRPSAQAAHAATVRASSAAQHASKPVQLSRKAAVPSQSARARAVSRHTDAADSKDFECGFQADARPLGPAH
jgi:hypothetical protein